MPFQRPAGRLPDRLRDAAERAWMWMQTRGAKRLIRDGALTAAGIIVLYGLFLWFTLPDISDPRNLIAAQSSVIVDRDGTELYRLYREEDRTFIPGTQIPAHMKNAIISIEDERFYDRGCLDVIALMRALLRLGQSGGASTLTRQLARNALDLKRENIISRKLKELILGCQLEARYNKEELLNLYLNWIPFGQNAYGLEQASQSYFSKSAKDLTLAQAAVLAAIPQRPTYFSPFGRHVHTEVNEETRADILAGTITKTSEIADDDFTIGLLGARVGSGATSFYVGGRADQVLRNMQNLGHITEAERLQALTELETMEFKRGRTNIRAPHFVLWVKQQVEELIAGDAEEGILDQGGLTIETTLDWDLQQAAEQVVDNRKADNEKYGIYNTALVSADPKTGEVLAYIGNTDYDDEEHDGKVDMARAPRQPGSSFKPFVYAAAFEKGYGPATILYDVPTKIGDDEPQNFDGKFWGLMNIRRALGSSRNIPAAKAFFMAGGEQSVLDMAHRLGAATPLKAKSLRRQENSDFEYGWPLAIGAAETPLFEMVQGFATIANAGTFRPLVTIKSIKDRHGNIIYAPRTEEEESQVIDPRIAYQITSVLSDVSARPNEYWQTVLSLPGVQAAAKTGTSNKCLERKPGTLRQAQGDMNKENLGACTKRKPSDLWTIGYTPTLVTGVWVGNADSTALADKAESLTNAAPIWKDYMARSLKVTPPARTTFAMPSGMLQPQVSLLSGELPTACTPVELRRGDVFLEEHAPSLADPACVQLEIDRVTGLLASDECPAEAREMGSFLKPVSVLAERFPQWQEAVIAWSRGGSSGAVLPLPLAPTEPCTLALTPGRLEKPRVFLTYPQDGEGVTYPAFRPQIDVRVGSGVREVRFEIDGKLVEKIASGATLDSPIRVPRTVSKDGSHTLRVTLTDTYFNTATAEASFRFEEDQSAPMVEITSPASGVTVKRGESFTIEAEADDRDGSLKYIEFYMGAKLLTRKPKAPFTAEISVTEGEGTQTLRAVATDTAGNTSEDSVTITVQP